MEKNQLILMLEDDPDDRFITESTLEELGYEVNLQFVKSSTELFSFLETSEKPFLILIDFNSSPLNAVQILKLVKENDEYKSIPVVILGDSSSSEYILECYRLGAGAFIKKPASVAETKNKINSFFNYWLNTVES